jgi:hypothetical protein
VVVVKGQQKLHPLKQWELVKRWDPDAQEIHSHGDLKTFKAKGGLLNVGRSLPIYDTMTWLGLPMSRLIVMHWLFLGLRMSVSLARDIKARIIMVTRT